jgi:galactonate dehydratase
MKITAINTFVVDTGFTPPRPWLYCAVRTDEGLTGYSEFGSPGLVRGLVGLVGDLGERLIGKDPTTVEKHYIDLYRHTRQASYGATQMAIAGLELALWDLAGKALGVPVWRLMGGPLRESQRVYWSHLATYRVTNWKLLGTKPLRTMDDLAAVAREAVARGYSAFKTNIMASRPVGSLRGRPVLTTSWPHAGSSTRRWPRSGRCGRRWDRASTSAST